MIRSLLVGLLMLALDIGGICYMLNSYSENDALSRRGVNSTGTTSGASTRTKRGSTSYWINFTYTVAGRTYQHGDSVTEKVFKKYSSGYFYFPQSIPIRYLPYDPDVVQVADPDLPADHHTPSPWLWILLLLWIGYGGFLIYACVPDGWFSRLRTGVSILVTSARRQIPSVSIAALSRKPAPTVLLAELKQLLDAGAITEDEFAIKKAEILKRI